jgi:hypothetical protein
MFVGGIGFEGFGFENPNALSCGHSGRQGYGWQEPLATKRKSSAANGRKSAGKKRPKRSASTGAKLSAIQTQIAYLGSDPPSADEEQKQKDKSYVIHVDRDQRFPRVWLQSVAGGRRLFSGEHGRSRRAVVPRWRGFALQCIA